MEHKRDEHSDGNKAPPLDFRNSASRLEDVYWLHHRCYMGEDKSV